MSSPRLQALNDAYSKLENGTRDFQKKAQNDLNENTKTSISLTEAQTMDKDGKIEDSVDPMIAEFYQQQLKKQKLQSYLPIEDWAALHNFERESCHCNDSSITRSSEVKKNAFKHESLYKEKDFDRIRKSIKNKLIQKLMASRLMEL